MLLSSKNLSRKNSSNSFSIGSSLPAFAASVMLQTLLSITVRLRPNYGFCIICVSFDFARGPRPAKVRASYEKHDKRGLIMNHLES